MTSESGIPRAYHQQQEQNYNQNKVPTQKSRYLGITRNSQKKLLPQAEEKYTKPIEVKLNKNKKLSISNKKTSEEIVAVIDTTPGAVAQIKNICVVSIFTSTV